MSQSSDYSPDDDLGTETFEQGDEAIDEETRLNPDFVEDLERDPGLNPTLSADDLELEEAGVLFDDPETLAVLDGGLDDPDGSGVPRARASQNDEGWDLSAGEEELSP